jgi:integrase
MEYMTRKQVVTLLAVAYRNNPVHHAALLTAYFTGARISQVLQLTGDHVDMVEMKVLMPASLKKGRKTASDLTPTGKPKTSRKSKRRFYRIHIDANPVYDMRKLRELAKLTGPNRLFGGLSRQYLDLAIKRYCREAGINQELAHAHCLRHSIAMIIWDATQRPGAITHYLAHKDASSAYQYLAENDGQLADEAVEKHAF